MSSSICVFSVPFPFGCFPNCLLFQLQSGGQWSGRVEAIEPWFEQLLGFSFCPFNRRNMKAFPMKVKGESLPRLVVYNRYICLVAVWNRSWERRLCGQVSIPSTYARYYYINRELLTTNKPSVVFHQSLWEDSCMGFHPLITYRNALNGFRLQARGLLLFKPLPVCGSQALVFRFSVIMNLTEH